MISVLMIVTWQLLCVRRGFTGTVDGPENLNEHGNRRIHQNHHQDYGDPVRHIPANDRSHKSNST